MYSNDFPTSVEDLIAWLNELYPHRCPNPSDSERDIWLYAGKRQLVDALISRYQQEMG